MKGVEYRLHIEKLPPNFREAALYILFLMRRVSFFITGERRNTGKEHYLNEHIW